MEISILRHINLIYLWEVCQSHMIIAHAHKCIHIWQNEEQQRFSIQNTRMKWWNSLQQFWCAYIAGYACLFVLDVQLEQFQLPAARKDNAKNIKKKEKPFLSSEKNLKTSAFWQPAYRRCHKDPLEELHFVSTYQICHHKTLINGLHCVLYGPCVH